MSNPDDAVRLVIQGAAFVLVIALWLGGVTVWYVRRSGQSRQIHERIGLTEAAGEQHVLRLWKDGQVVETAVRSGKTRVPLAQRLQHLGQDAGWKTPMLPILGVVSLLTLLLALALFIAFGNFLLPAMAAALVLFGFRFVLQYSVDKRTGLFEKQLVDALDLGGRSLRAGHPLNGAFHLIAEEVAAPVGPVFADICEQEALGVGLQRALEAAASSSRSPDMKIFAASVIIQLRSGGNLADMMERVAWVVRERMRLSRRARVLTAEAQLSKWVLMALPIGLFLVLNVLNPDYMHVLYTTFIGNVLLAVGGAGLLVGSWVMGRMANLKY